jgi:hypothetical protein
LWATEFGEKYEYGNSLYVLLYIRVFGIISLVRHMFNIVTINYAMESQKKSRRSSFATVSSTKRLQWLKTSGKSQYTEGIKHGILKILC